MKSKVNNYNHTEGDTMYNLIEVKNFIADHNLVSTISMIMILSQWIGVTYFEAEKIFKQAITE